jgi:hypothetical protein
MIRRAVTLAALLVVLAPPAATAHRGAPLWSLSTLMRRINGTPVSVGSWNGRVRPGATLCSGEGSVGRWGGVSHWRHFICTWTTFHAGALDRDMTFRVHTLSRTRFLITSAHWGAT